MPGWRRHGVLLPGAGIEAARPSGGAGSFLQPPVLPGWRRLGGRLPGCRAGGRFIPQAPVIVDRGKRSIVQGADRPGGCAAACPGGRPCRGGNDRGTGRERLHGAGAILRNMRAAAGLHLLDDVDSQQLQAQFDRPGGQIAQQQPALAKLVGLGLQDRALLEEGRIAVGQLEQVGGQLVGAIVGDGQLEGFGEPQQLEPECPFSRPVEQDRGAGRPQGI